MSLDFYYGSGSPFAWHVWLALEHKQLPYRLHVMSFQGGELKQPAYLAINPRGKVPALVDDGFALWETLAIIEYLEERYPERALFPAGITERATTRRLGAEAYAYLYPALRKLLELTLFRSDGDADAAKITIALDGLSEQLGYFDKALDKDYLLDTLSAADFALYPLLALTHRVHVRRPALGIDGLFTSNMTDYMRRIEQLPYYSKTYPPHWQE